MGRRLVAQPSPSDLGPFLIRTSPSQARCTSLPPPPQSLRSLPPLSPALRQKMLSFVYNLICPDNCFYFALRFARVDPALGLFFFFFSPLVRRAFYGKFPFRRGRRRRTRGDRSQSPEGTSPPPPPGVQKPTPSPTQWGTGGRGGRTAAPGSGPRPPTHSHSPRLAQPAGNQ